MRVLGVVAKGKRDLRIFMDFNENLSGFKLFERAQESPRVAKSARKSPRAHESRREHTIVAESAQKSPRACESGRKSATVAESVR